MERGIRLREYIVSFCDLALGEMIASCVVLYSGRNYIDIRVSSSVVAVASRSWVLKTYANILAGRNQARNVVYVQ
jgi:hypothetical protein